ncbi:MAG: TIR domain-containing protein [Sphingomonadales bacterium]
MSYQYDIFLSYPRAGATGEWVRNHFRPVLEECLDLEMPVPPAIWYDEDQRPGVNWPLNLQQALLHSRLLVAVWSPPYFRSQWCVGEWQSMLARQRALGLSTVQNPLGLVYPVVFADGIHFPQEARDIQSRRDLSIWGIPFPQFRKTTAYQEFWTRMREVAAEIAAHLSMVPPWSPGWPVLSPPIPTAPHVPLPRL